LGPVLGGCVTEYLSWRMIFFMNVVPGVLCLALVFLVIPKVQETVQRSPRPRWPGDAGRVPGQSARGPEPGPSRSWDAPYIQRLFVIAG
jgi:DHA2 family multidrug resistance protein